MLNLTTVQKIGLAIGVLGFLATAGTQLTDIFAPFGSSAPLIVKEIVSLSGFLSGILGIVLAFLTGQANTIRAVNDMPGVEKILVNAKASPALATLAVAQEGNKVQAIPEAKAAVTATAATAAAAS